MSSEPPLDLRLEEAVLDGEAFAVTLGRGRVHLWLGRKTPPGALEAILQGVAALDPRAETEIAVECPVADLPRYEAQGLELVSYATHPGKVKARFQVPFHRPEAVACLGAHLAHRLDNGPLEHLILWEGTEARVQEFLRHLQRVPGWSLRRKKRKKDYPPKRRTTG
ncbi:MAG: hypothetical protein HY558_05915 [Euryarchaeota archaeon]|nr:hypothetical protein [Euryarchaeota archaeon]